MRIGRMFLTGAAALLIALATGCGGTNNGTTVVKTTPTITWATPAAITYGTALSSTQLNATASVAGSFVYNPTAGTVLTAGSQTLSTAFTPNDTADYNNASANVTLTVNKATPSITWTPATSVTNEQDLSSVLNAMSATSGTFAYTATISGGTAVAVTSSSVLSTVGSYTITAQFTPTDTADYNTPAPITAPLTVTQAPPVIVAVDKPYVYCEGVGTNCYAQFTLTTADTTTTDTLSFGGPVNGNAVSWSRNNATQAVVNVFFNQYAPGWYTFKICRAGGTSCSSTVATAFLAAQNTLAVSATGELYQLDQTRTATGYYVRNFTASDATLTAVGSGDIQLPTIWVIPPMGISYDNATNLIVVGQNFFNLSGANVGGIATPSGSGLPLGTVAKNGYGALTQPGSNNFFQYPIANGVQSPAAVNPCNQPSSLAVGIVGTETDAFVLCRGNSPALWKVSLSSSSSGSSVPLTGIMPINTVQASNPDAGGWQVAYAEAGPAAATVAILSTPDAVVEFVNTTTMQVSSSPATLTGDGIPVQIVSDDVHGNFIVAFVHPQTSTTNASNTTFARVNPTNGAVTTLISTSAKMPSGFAVSADGNWLYICSLSACETQPNQ